MGIPKSILLIYVNSLFFPFIIPLKKGSMFFTPSLGLSVCLSVCVCVCLSVCLSSGLWQDGWTQQHDITWEYYPWYKLNTATFSRWSVCGSCSYGSFIQNMYPKGLQTWLNSGWPWPTFSRSFGHFGPRIFTIWWL